MKAAEPEQLIEAYSGFISKIAASYGQITREHGYIGFDDLIQEGRLALLEAQSSYDPGEGLSFAKWAAYRIKTRIKRAIGCKADGTLKEQPALILDAPPPGLEISDGVNLIDTIPSDDDSQDDIITRSEEQEEVRKAVDRIQNQTQKAVIKSIYFQGKGYKETADEMGLSVDSVRGRKENALSALRRDNKLKVYMMLDLHYGSLSRFRYTRTSIEEEYILKRERRFDEKHGEGAYVREMLADTEDDPYSCLRE